MKSLVSQIDLLIECRDYRIPLTSRNPLFESTLAGQQRLIVYTKKDLGSKGSPEDVRREQILRHFYKPTEVLFCDHKSREHVKRILHAVADITTDAMSLTGSRMMVIGMPNVGKSSLLNALRNVSLGKKKVAHTGDQPGVTRKIGTSVKITEGKGGSEGAYLVDTPGVFMPYVPNAEVMLKLALCGCVKDTIIAPVTLADYLLYHINRVAPELYEEYHLPTNNIIPLLESMAKKTGRLSQGGSPDTEATALWMIQRWRQGHLGQFVLDDITEATLQSDRDQALEGPASFHQARKAAKDAQRERSRRRTPTAAG